MDSVIIFSLFVAILQTMFDHGDLESDLKRKLKIEAGGAGCRWVTGDGEMSIFGRKDTCEIS